MFSEENVPVEIVNPAIQAMKVIQAEMAGESEKSDLNSEEKILRLVKETRNENSYTEFAFKKNTAVLFLR